MTKKVILNIATSLDGFIARKNGSVDWLPAIDNSSEDYGMKEFMDSVGTVILGNTTYTQFGHIIQIRNVLFFQEKILVRQTTLPM